MAIQVSPGVHVSEVDLTTNVPAISTSIGAIAGQLRWGPANVPVQVTSEVQLVSTFGSPDSNTANVFFTAANFLAYSNNLQVVRANVTGAKNATGNGQGVVINNENDYFNGVYATPNGDASANSKWSARYLGSLGNSLEVVVWANSAAWKVDANTASPTSLTQFATIFDYAPGTSPYVLNATGYAANDEIHVAVIDKGGLITGTANTVLEKYQSLSAISDAKKPDGSSNYYKEVIFRNSKYIYWTGHPQVNVTHWGANTASVNSNNFIGWDASANVVSLSGGTDGAAVAGDIENAYSNFADPEQIDVSLVMTADANAVISQYVIDDVVENRNDCIALVSPTLANTLGVAGDSTDPSVSIVNYANALSAYSSYAVMDSGWKYQYDKYNDLYRWVPLNGDIAGLCAYTDNVRDPWWSPAGLQRGIIKNVVKLGFNPNQAQRDTLYKAGINPVVTFPGQGTMLYGDKTLQNRPSAFDRINVRRLFIVLEKTISKAAQSSLFEFNDKFTQAQFVGLVEPFLRSVQGRRGIYAFKVVCDSTNNTPAVIDANQFVGDIYIQPARSINFIQLNFVATRTGVNFSEIVGQF